MRDAERQAGRARAQDQDVVEVDAFGMASVVLYGHDAGAQQARVPDEPRSYLKPARRWPAFRLRGN